jgi:hypothetical protein
LIKSPLMGPKGNIEFLVWLSLPSGEAESEELNQIVMHVLS